MDRSPERETPKVSVCLLTRNRAHYLPGVIESWLGQTFKDFELVISNDASTDDTDLICREYAAKDHRITYFKQEKNLNFPACYKFVLNHARGEYVIMASDDDLWDKRFLEECVKVYEKHPEYVLVFAHMVDIDREGNAIKHFRPEEYMPFGDAPYERLKKYTLFYFEDGKNQHIFGLWRREKVLDDPMFGPHPKDDLPPYYWGFDNYFIFRNIAKGPVGFVPEVLFLRRSRVREEYRPPRPIVPRLAVTFYHRLRKIFDTPYFWYILRLIPGIEGLTFWEKCKLIGWNLYVMARVFFVRKI